MKLFLAILIVPTATLVNTQSGCGVCSTVSRATCVGENTFQICEGYPLKPLTTRTFTCPGTKKCTDAAAICSDNVAPSCIPQCRRCSSDNRFACIDNRTLAFCFGEQTPSDVIHRCPDGFVCSIKQVDFCVDAATNTPSCNTDEKPPTTTPPAPPSIFDRCRAVPTIPGRYPLVEDKTCRKYLHCFYANNQLIARILTCQPDKIFDDQKRTCVPIKANKCRR